MLLRDLAHSVVIRIMGGTLLLMTMPSGNWAARLEWRRKSTLVRLLLLRANSPVNPMCGTEESLAECLIGTEFLFHLASALIKM